MSNNKKYFRHDAGARNDDKLTALRIEHGPAGYGIYFMLLERLREEDNYRGELTDRYIKALAYDFHADAAMVRSVIRDFQLFKIDEKAKTFSSPRFDEEMQYMEELSRTRQTAINKRWNPCPDTNESKKDTIVSQSDTKLIQENEKPDTKSEQNNPKNAQPSKLTTIDRDGQQRTKNTLVSKSDTKLIQEYSKSDTNESVLYNRDKKEKSPLDPPIKEKTRTEQEQNDGLIEGRNEGRTDEEFEMPDETAEAEALRARLRDVDWPECDIDEFMRLADYGQDAEARPLQLLARFEVDRMKYEPTQYTPINIMGWLRSEEKRGELQPRLTSKALLVLRDLRRRDIAGSVKNQVRAWLEGAPDRQQRTDRAERMSAALKDIDRGRINRPDAFLIATMKKA